jgi:hypothetical protein
MRIMAPTFLADVPVLAAAFLQEFHFVATLIAFVFEYWHWYIPLFGVQKVKTNISGLLLFVA